MFDLFQKPFYQLLATLLITIIVLLITRTRSTESVWVIAGVLYGLFILVNIFFVLASDQQWSYFFISLGFSLLYLFAVWAITSLYLNIFKTEGSGEAGMMFLIIIYHPFLLLLLMLIKWLYFRFF